MNNTKYTREEMLEAAKAFMKIATMFGRVPEPSSMDGFNKFWNSLFGSDYRG